MKYDVIALPLEGPIQGLYRKRLFKKQRTLNVNLAETARKSIEASIDQVFLVWKVTEINSAPAREDVNFDGVIDILDISLAARAFSSDPIHPWWRSGEADVNHDGIVNILDIEMIAVKLGRKTLP